MAYFGTDQSQVQRYLGGTDVRASRIGLLFNGLLKVPLQFFILFIGVLVLLFFQFHQPPLHFNDVNKEKVMASPHAEAYQELEQEHDALFEEKKELVRRIEAEKGSDAEQREALQAMMEREEGLRDEAKSLVKKADAEAETKDADYIFVSFVMQHLPVGVVGLLLAVIFSAAMSSTSAELNSLASTATVDVYKRNLQKTGGDSHYLGASRIFTLLFGALAILFAALASLFENLIQAVNILGSIFYGTILGVFLAAFFVKRIKGNSVFIAALIAQGTIAFLYYLGEQEVYELSYLWFNLIGPIIVIGVGLLIELFKGKRGDREL